MNAQLMIRFTSVLSLVVIIGCRSEKHENTANDSNVKVYDSIKGLSSDRLNKELDKIVFVNVNFTGETFEEVFAFLIQRGSELHPSAPYKVPFHIESDVSLDAEIVGKMENIPFKDILSDVCKQAGASWRIKDGMIYIQAAPIEVRE